MARSPGLGQAHLGAEAEGRAQVVLMGRQAMRDVMSHLACCRLQPLGSPAQVNTALSEYKAICGDDCWANNADCRFDC